MELRTLRYFLAVAREASFTKAANVLHVTQPTLSRQLKELEEELDTDLFVRHSHSVSLTEDGVRLMKRAEEIVDIVQKTRAEFKTDKNDIAGDIYIGAGETPAVHTLARVIADIRKDYPKVRVHIFSGNGPDLVERLEKGLLDFALLIEPIDLSKFEYLEL
ncbi:MAG: LysR family transcriptional regulator, partial [Sutterellaceae bacterium]|nr:LysR family transcriptional regulator [Sutterellaceae bacterium]